MKLHHRMQAVISSSPSTKVHMFVGRPLNRPFMQNEANCISGQKMMLIAKETGNIIPPHPQKKKRETGKILLCYIKLRNKLSEKKAADA